MALSEKEKVERPIKKIKWFSDMVENLPKRKGDSFTDKVVDIESAKVVRAASEVALDSVRGRPEKAGVEKGISEGLEQAGKQIITEKLTGKSPIESKVMEAIGDMVADSVRERLSGGGRASEAELELRRRDRQDELKAMFQRFNEEVVAPLAAQVQEIAEKSKGGDTKMTTDDAVEMVMSAQERAKKLLETQGYSVESIHVTKEDVKKLVEEEEQKYKDRLAKAKEEWEKVSGAQVEVEKERIRATENILEGVVNRIFDIFLGPIKEKIEEAVERGAFRRPGPGK